MTRRLRPLTERILAQLPGPRVLWIAVWALVPWLNAGVNLVLDTEGTSAVWEQSRALVLLNYASLSFAIVITLWGTERLARRLDGPSYDDLERARGRGKRAVSRADQRHRPVIASAVTSIVFAAGAQRSFSPCSVCTARWSR